MRPHRLLKLRQCDERDRVPFLLEDVAQFRSLRSSDRAIVPRHTEELLLRVDALLESGLPPLEPRTSDIALCLVVIGEKLLLALAILVRYVPALMFTVDPRGEHAARRDALARCPVQHTLRCVPFPAEPAHEPPQLLAAGVARAGERCDTLRLARVNGVPELHWLFASASWPATFWGGSKLHLVRHARLAILSFSGICGTRIEPPCYCRLGILGRRREGSAEARRPHSEALHAALLPCPTNALAPIAYLRVMLCGPQLSTLQRPVTPAPVPVQTRNVSC
mmetsp:Transcript_28963/g.68678  ORF Transcript_28963/g.68678 Transcript_28963/m.68678 type:complete len:279 (-) Transcript_28963:194-1030(-)